MKAILAVVLLATSGSALPSDNPLMGWWITVYAETPMMVFFSERHITWVSSDDPVEGASSMPVHYRGQGDSWSVEMLTESGVIVGLITADLESDDELILGKWPNAIMLFRRVDWQSELLRAVL